MGASLCARSLGAPTVRAYQSVARTPQTSTSQQLWRLAGVGALAGLGMVAIDGLRERCVDWGSLLRCRSLVAVCRHGCMLKRRLEEQN